MVVLGKEIGQYQFTAIRGGGEEYLLNEDMEIWERYNMMI